MTTDELKRAKELRDKRGDAAEFERHDFDDEYVLFPLLVDEVGRLQGEVDGYELDNMGFP